MPKELLPHTVSHTVPLPVRPYDKEVSDRVTSLSGRFHVEVIGKSYGKRRKIYPVYKVMTSDGAASPKKEVLISGGVHGSEPAGVYSVLEFLDKHVGQYLDEFDFFAYPCHSPWAFEHDRGKDYLGINPNRMFTTPPLTHEAHVFQRSLARGPGEYAFAMDMHETEPDDLKTFNLKSEELPDKFYMWDFCDDKSRRVGHEAVQAVRETGYPICEAEKIWGDTNSGGVIFYPEGAGDVDYNPDMPTCEGFLKKHYTDHAITTETFTAHPMKDRVAAHIAALKAVLESYR